ncbi:MAG TPA: hypothetical protein VE693_01795 [Gaiellaceae bacterium]|nr:hypothetical protein [Gaiellaceae bacterium]
MVAIALLASLVLVPLGFEYADLRSRFGLSRRVALAITALVFPAFAAAAALTSPLAGHAVAQWTATVAMTLVVYSLAARAIASSACAAGTAPSRRTRG